MLAAFMLLLGSGTPAAAVESIILRAGPLSQTIPLQDLETFAQTGVVPETLELYRPLLTPQAQFALQSRLTVAPAVSSLIADEVMASPGGQQLLTSLYSVVPTLTLDEFYAALKLAAQDPNGMSVLGVLKAIPEDTLEISIPELLSLGARLGLAQLEDQALSRVLDNELYVHADQPFRAVVPDPTRAGEAEVEQWNLTLRDRSRDRSIPIDLYWSRQSHGPLVVLSHGFGADRRFLAYLAQHLASHGLTVVSVEHPGSNVEALISMPTEMNAKASEIESSRLLPATEFLDRPKDISFVLDRLSHFNETSYSLRGRINTDDVTFIGHSLGGYTGLALAGAELDTRNLADFCQNLNPTGFSPADWLQCAALELPTQQANLSDARIKQLIVMNPLSGALFGTAGLSQIKIPTLMIASTRDGVTPVAQQQLAPFRQLTGEKHLITIIGGTHLSVGDPHNLNAELSQVPFMPALPGLASQRLRRFVQGVSLSFAMQRTPSGPQYAGFLTPHYAQIYSTPDLPLRLTQQIPHSVESWLNLYERSPHRRNRSVDYLPSLLHLEAIDVHHRFNTLQQQMVAYLRTTPPSLTAIYLPRTIFRPNLHASKRHS